MGTFDPTEPTFPNNVVQLIDLRIKAKWDNVNSVKRPLRPTDKNFTIATFGSLWVPDGQSYEMGRNVAPVGVPTLDRYTCISQTLVKSMDETAGLAQSSVLSEELRAMLYADPSLRVGLAALTTSVGGQTKLLKKFYVGTQRYMSNEINGEFVYMSTLEFTFETETI